MKASVRWMYCPRMWTVSSAALTTCGKSIRPKEVKIHRCVGMTVELEWEYALSSSFFGSRGARDRQKKGRLINVTWLPGTVTCAQLSTLSTLGTSNSILPRQEKVKRPGYFITLCSIRKSGFTRLLLVLGSWTKTARHNTLLLLLLVVVVMVSSSSSSLLSFCPNNSYHAFSAQADWGKLKIRSDVHWIPFYSLLIGGSHLTHQVINF